ncbi:MAG TPA: nickel pincer cofactor biosynthesis protein LarC [Bacilli bacterium]
MRTLYLDCVSGIAGDMALSALVDLGADPDYIIRHLSALPIDSFTMEFVPVTRRGISAKWLKLHFAGSDAHHHHHDHHHHHGHDDRNHERDHYHHHEHVQHHHEHRSAANILRMIANSSLPERVKARSQSIFRVIADAEGKIHGVDPDKVHFHEVGAMDSILDIIGVCLALESLGVDETIVSPVPVGSGRVRMAHGVYPIPAPATAEILVGVPLSSFTAPGELTTPTGAGIVKALASGFGSIPAGTVEKIGYGAGTKDFEHPNVLRAMLISRETEKSPLESIIVLETQVDDMRGETLGYVMDRLFAAGALDVYYTPIYMKKNRPGVLITVLCSHEACGRCEGILFSETSTFGVRRAEMKRRALARKWVEAHTKYGTIRIKQAYDGDRLVKESPEYEDVAQAARSSGVPLETVYREARKGSVGSGSDWNS